MFSISFRIHTYCNVALSFIESWAHPIVRAIGVRVVVDVAVLAVHIPYVACSTSRAKPNIQNKGDRHMRLTEYYPILIINIIFHFVAVAQNESAGAVFSKN